METKFGRGTTGGNGEETRMHTSKSAFEKKILVIGLGEIGYHDAQYMRSLGFSVDGYDISDKVAESALKDGVIEKIATDFGNYDYYIICISTHKNDNMYLPEMDQVYHVAQRLAMEGKPGALVGIESTIKAGTSEWVNQILGHRLHVAHLPQRFFSNGKEEHGVNQTRILGFCQPCCKEEALHFYKEMLDIPVHVVSSIKIAELSHVVENTYRFLEIAFAEELKMICDHAEIDFEELRRAVNTKWNVNILEARDGIGRHCLPKDSQMFLDIINGMPVKSLISTAKTIDKQYRAHLLEKSADTIKQLRLDQVRI